MPHRPIHPPPPSGVERRQQFRREDDVETHEIVDHAVEDAPIVRRLLRTGQVAAAMVGIGTVLGATGAGLGYRLVGPNDAMAQQQSALTARMDANAERITRQSLRIDSLLAVIGAMQKDLQTMTYIQCVQLRRNDPDLLPDGCSATAQRSRRN